MKWEFYYQLIDLSRASQVIVNLNFPVIHDTNIRVSGSANLKVHKRELSAIKINTMLMYGANDFGASMQTLNGFIDFTTK